MKQSTISSQYYIQPPNIPEFMYKFSVLAWYKLMEWSYREYRERTKRNAMSGNLREITVQHREYSPIRILAELHGLRRLCSIMTPETWKKFDRREGDYLIRCFEMREFLFRSAS